MTLNYVTLTVDLYDGQGNVLNGGTATFAPTVQLTDATDHEIITGAGITAAFHASGSPAIKLLATDNSNVLPAGWAWTVTFSGVPGNPASFNFFLPYANGASQNLSAISPVATAATQVPYTALSWVNVRNYGADPTGNTDSTTAIQNALLSFGTLGGWTAGKGGIVYLPAGDYATSKPLIIPSGVWMLGDGWATIVDLNTGSDCDVIQFSTYNSSAQAAILGVSAGSIANAYFSGIEKLQVHGDALHTTVAGYRHGINITTNPLNSAAGSDPDFDPSPVVRDVWIKAVTGDGLYHSGRSGALIERVWSAYHNGNAFTPSFDTTMVDCLAEGSNCGFYLNHGSNTGTGCKSFNNKDYTWVSGHAYTAGKVAIYSGTMYFCISAVTSATAPSSDATHWTALSATSPQAGGYGYYWNTNAGEHSWAACDSQQNSTGDYYVKGANQGPVVITGSSSQVNFNNGQAAYNSSNPNNYASLTLDGCSGVVAVLGCGGLGSGNSNGVLCTRLGSASGNTLIASTDGSAGTLFSGSPPAFALVDGRLNAALVPVPVALTDGSSVAIDASKSNVFDWPLGGSSHTLAAPSSPVNGQGLKVRIAYSGSYTPLFNAIYDFGTDGQPTWTATNGKVDEVGFEYNSGISKWCCQGSKLGF